MVEFKDQMSKKKLKSADSKVMKINDFKSIISDKLQFKI